MNTIVEPLFKINVRCSHCKYAFQTSRVRPSFRKGMGTDSDFCVHYKDHNPDYYVVRVCPACGYSFSESFTDSWTDTQAAEFKARVANQWGERDYGGERSWEDALETYKLALISAQIKGERERVVAGLLHHIAWLYRYKEQDDNEQKFLKFALDSYTIVYETEEMDYNNVRLMYLLGELNRRLRNYHEAVKWFSRIINDKRIMDAAMIRQSREQWIVTREDMLAARLDLPEEMIESSK